MIDNKVLYDSSVYTNVQGLGALSHEYKTNPAAVKKEISQQFETLMVQMLLKSMRDTNKEFASGLMDNEQSGFYNELYDKQLAMVLSKSGLGIAKNIENYLDKNTPVDTAGSVDAKPVKDIEKQALMSNNKSDVPAPVTTEEVTVALKKTEPSFASADDFVKGLWEHAKAAAKIIGVDPKILLAQAALETNWGKKIIPQADGTSTNNLFNIKADGKWRKDAVECHTLEETDGVMVREKSKFRVYASFQESFQDYTQFLQSNSRYADALKNAAEPRKFVDSLQSASYATDTHYAEKIMSIYNSNKLNDFVLKSKLI